MQEIPLIDGELVWVRIGASTSLRCLHAKGSTDPVRFDFFDGYRYSIGFRRAGAGSGNSSPTPKVGQRSQAENEADAEGVGQRLPAMAIGRRHLHYLSRRSQRFLATGYQRRAREINRAVLTAAQQQSPPPGNRL